MKATGIVRRIDDLGRVVIPKEIRRTLRIRESDPLEIFTDREGEIILKKYSPIGELGSFAKEYAEALASASGQSVCITDRDQVIAVAGGIKKYSIGMGYRLISPSSGLANRIIPTPAPRQNTSRNRKLFFLSFKKELTEDTSLP